MFGCTKWFFERPVKLCPVPLSVKGIKGWGWFQVLVSVYKGGSWQEKLIQTFTQQSICSSPSKTPLKSASCSWQQDRSMKQETTA